MPRYRRCRYLNCHAMVELPSHTITEQLNTLTLH